MNKTKIPKKDINKIAVIDKGFELFYYSIEIIYKSSIKICS